MAKADSAVYPTDPFRVAKAYTASQAAMLAGTSPQTVSNWLRGYEGNGHHMDPVFNGRGGETQASAPLRVSFLELAEIIVVARFRHLGIKLQRLRDAHRYVGKAFGLAFPFASLQLTAAGGHVLHDFEATHPGQMLALDTDGQQWTLPHIVMSELHNFDCIEDDPWFLRWFPEGKKGPIVIDPHIAAGKPVIRGSAVSVGIVHRRFVAGEHIDEIAQDFELEPTDVEIALRYAARAA